MAKEDELSLAAGRVAGSFRPGYRGQEYRGVRSMLAAVDAGAMHQPGGRQSLAQDLAASFVPQGRNDTYWGVLEGSKNVLAAVDAGVADKSEQDRHAVAKEIAKAFVPNGYRGDDYWHAVKGVEGLITEIDARK